MHVAVSFGSLPLGYPFFCALSLSSEAWLSFVGESFEFEAQVTAYSLKIPLRRTLCLKRGFAPFGLMKL